MNQKHPSLTILASTIASLMLSACGGGSGGKTKTPSLPTTNSSSVASSSVAAINKAPVFTSGGSVDLDEGSAATGYIAAATDANNDTLSFSITGGADEAKFSLDATSGTLSFITAPDFEAPDDANQDNIYEVQLTATDGKGGLTNQLVQVSIKNVTAKLSSLSREANVTLVPGNTLVAQSTCNTCDASATRYEWYVEGSSTPVSTTSSYTLLPADSLKKITLNATPYTSSGEAGQTEQLVMQRNAVKNVYFARGVYGALKTDGSVVTWGDFKGDMTDKDLTHVKEVVSNGSSLAAIKEDGSVVSWGNTVNSGGAGVNSTGLDLTHIASIVGGYDMFAAINEDGDVFAWGDFSYGGDFAYGGDIASIDLTNVSEVVQDHGAFAAIKKNGDVVTWGNYESGGVSTRYSSQLTHVTKVFSCDQSFAALKENGTVVTWGSTTSPVNPLTNVNQIASNRFSFAALKNDGTVTTWGNYYGNDSSHVTLTHVVSIASSWYGFAALKDDGSVVSWGSDSYNGSDKPSVNLTNVKKIVAASQAFSAIKNDGSVVSWGYSTSTPTGLTNVTKLISNGRGFGAVNEDGTVVTWGNGFSGGSDYEKSLTNITSIFAYPTKYYSPEIYAAIDNDGKLYTWGDFTYGGDITDLPGLDPEDMIISSTLAQ